MLTENHILQSKLFKLKGESGVTFGLFLSLPALLVHISHLLESELWEK